MTQGSLCEARMLEIHSDSYFTDYPIPMLLALQHDHGINHRSPLPVHFGAQNRS
jgi:hypothetical protein